MLQKQTEKLEEGLQEREHEHPTNIHTNITQQTYILTFAHLQKQTEKLEEGLLEKANLGGGEVITSIYQESTQPHQPPQVFGIQSKKNKASITELLRCTTTELGDETDYPDLSGKQRKGRLPPAKATKSSLIVAKCRQPLSEKELAQKKSIEEFKMKKFKNVQPRIKCYM